MIFLKQIAGILAAPLSIALLLALVAALFRWRGRPRVAFWLIVVAAAIAYLGSLPLVGNALIAPLERSYPPLSDAQRPATLAGIVVLGSGYEPRAGIPVTGALDEDGLARVVEGVRLAMRLSGTPLILSGGASPGSAPSALGYARLARELGIPQSSIVVIDQARDTAEESRVIARLLGNAPFVLVTSAYHMPRAMRLMRRAATRPIAAPTGQREARLSGGWWCSLVPSGGGLRNSERAVHEYMGLAAMALGAD